MELETLLAELEHLTAEQYGYLGIAAIFGPILLKLLGFKLLGNLIRPLALVIIVGGIYARQQRMSGQQ